MSTPPPPKDLGPAVRFPPPILFLAGLGCGALLDRLVPLWRLPDAPAMAGAGLVLVLSGLALVYAGIVTFRRFRTAVYPNRPAKLVVDSGPFAYTRNPMYVGMTVFYAGMVLLLRSVWAVVFLPVVLGLLVRFVIRREERHLTQRFPEEYAAYCARVPRWL
ncbi:MAG: methyltransferase family protein [Gemmatimonas sp.]|jgi:protein-S-isoprenylcysteine O-methyltransferase Ste14|uniref:methyltransferase family protein n=1 Tax=Gemmatimonas sp. TaxID=1962908 RepID=UPI00391F1B83|nr:isoprenylcysteine carboxylmethyltransferase family protein [Gemmatimonadota bacterium]